MRWIAIVALVLSVAAQAVVETYEFSDDSYRARYLEFTQVLRCPKCQNQNLADSNAPIAADLRKELHRLLEEGKTDEDITRFMVSRYGDYVLYDPPLEYRTLVLWAGPVVMLLIGLVVVFGLVRKRRPESTDAAIDVHLSDREREQLAQLLKDDKGNA